MCYLCDEDLALIMYYYLLLIRMADVVCIFYASALCVTVAVLLYNNLSVLHDIFGVTWDVSKMFKYAQSHRK